MKIAVSAKGNNLESQLDPRFGRASFLLVVETDTMGLEVLDNSRNVQAFKGAGIQAATSLADKGVKVLLTGHVGPNAFKTLEAAGIKVVGEMTGIIRQAIEGFMDGKTTYSSEANADAHW